MPGADRSKQGLVFTFVIVLSIRHDKSRFKRGYFIFPSNIKYQEGLFRAYNQKVPDNLSPTDTGNEKS